MNRWKKADKVLDHDLFRSMTRDHFGSWVGEAVFAPVGHTVQIRIDGPPEGPPDWAKACFEELTLRFPRLETEARKAMFERYTWHGIPEGCPTPYDAQGMGEFLVMDDIHLAGPESLTLGFGFRDGLGWDDLMFTVEVESWAVVHCVADD